MKVSRVVSAGWYAECPYCKEELEDSGSGSLMFASCDLLQPKDLLCECSSCGKESRLPFKCLFSKQQLS